jgi:hypothetical protein
VKIHRSKPTSRYTIVPNALLQDQRLTFTARGILSDILSRSDGWSTSADAQWELARRVRPDVAEGRRIVRAAFGEAKALGYIVESRERQDDGTFATVLHVYDTPGHGADRHTTSGMSVTTCDDAQTSSSDRRTGSGMSVATSGNGRLPSSDRHTGSGTSIETTNYKELKEKEEIALDAYASGMPCDDAHASSAAATASARDISTTESATMKPKPRRVPLDKRLDEHLAALGPGVIDAILRDCADCRSGLVGWAAKEARKELDINWLFDPLDDSGGEYARRVVGKMLMKLTKPGGGGTTAETDELLGDFKWPAERRPSPGKRPRKDRPRLPWIVFYPRPAEADAPAAHGALYRRVTALADDALAAKVAEFRAYRPGIWKDSEESARDQLAPEGGDRDAPRVARLAYQYAIKHAIENYKGDWPMFVVPEAPCVLGVEVGAAA